MLASESCPGVVPFKFDRGPKRIALGDQVSFPGSLARASEVLCRLRGPVANLLGVEHLHAQPPCRRVGDGRNRSPHADRNTEGAAGEVLARASPSGSQVSPSSFLASGDKLCPTNRPRRAGLFTRLSAVAVGEITPGVLPTQTPRERAAGTSPDVVNPTASCLTNLQRGGGVEQLPVDAFRELEEYEVPFAILSPVRGATSGAPRGEGCSGQRSTSRRGCDATEPLSSGNAPRETEDPGTSPCTALV